MAELSNGSTKVYYHLDGSTYMSEIPVTNDLTLEEFKKVFNRKGYTYFFKEWDPHLKREVKVEISDDRQILHKSANGLIELYLLNAQNNDNNIATGASYNADTLPKTKSTVKTTNATRKTTIGREHRHPITKHAHHHLQTSSLSLSSPVTNSSDMDICGGQRVSMVTTGTEASSDIQTLISKRAGENLAEIYNYNSTSEDPYNNHTSISSGVFLSNNRKLAAPMPSAADSTTESITAAVDQTLLNVTTTTINANKQRRQRQKKQRYYKPYVPSTISSESENSSYSLPRIEEVKIQLHDAPLGIKRIACLDGSIFISSIQPGSAAEKCGHLEIGDQIVQINDIRFDDLNEKQALELLKKYNAIKKTITIYVAKRARGNGESSEEQRSDGLSFLCETTQQLDISEWVESTKNCVEKCRPFLEVPSVESQVPVLTLPECLLKNKIDATIEQKKQLTTMDETSDEEHAAYLDRRNGIGARFVPALKQIRLHERGRKLLEKKQRTKTSVQETLCAVGTLENDANIPSTSHPIALDAVFPGAPPTATAISLPPPKVQQPLHVSMDPLFILHRMAEPDSGLTIRDRKWLKIPVPMSFIGEEMINWLLANVQGLQDRKKAKAFASDLLKKGYIKHVANISSFSEKCYFIFDDAIIAHRLRKIEEPHMQKPENFCSLQHQLSQKSEPLMKRNGGVVMAETNLMACPGGVATNKIAGATTAFCSGAMKPPESTTEITYMSNPSSPFFGAHPMAQHQIAPQLIVANNPHYPSVLNKKFVENSSSDPNKKLENADTLNNNNLIALRSLNPSNFGGVRILPVWPISPIPFGRNLNVQKITGLKQQQHVATVHEKCESPEATTNDYASLINCDGPPINIDEILLQPLPTETNRQLPLELNNNNNNNENSTIFANNNNVINNNNGTKIPTTITTHHQQFFQTPNVLLPSPPLLRKHQHL